MICPNCGANCSPETSPRFCNQCGARLAPPAPPLPDTAAGQAPVYTPPANEAMAENARQTRFAGDAPQAASSVPAQPSRKKDAVRSGKKGLQMVFIDRFGPERIGLSRYVIGIESALVVLIVAIGLDICSDSIGCQLLMALEVAMEI